MIMKESLFVALAVFSGVVHVFFTYHHTLLNASGYIMGKLIANDAVEQYNSVPVYLALGFLSTMSFLMMSLLSTTQISMAVTLTAVGLVTVRYLISLMEVRKYRAFKERYTQWGIHGVFDTLTNIVATAYSCALLLR